MQDVHDKACSGIIALFPPAWRTGAVITVSSSANVSIGASAIADVHADRIVIRGIDLCADAIGKQSFTEYFLFLLTGARPAPALIAVTDACLIAIAEHGLVPSVQAARMTLAAAPDAMQGAVAAGLLGCGSVILGASETAGLLLAGIVRESGGADPAPAALRAVQALRAARRTLPGFGHPTHKKEDPRATRLLTLAGELGAAGPHALALRAVEQQVQAVYGRFLPMNVSAAIPAVLLDAGFPVAALKGVPLLARTGALIAHLLEERDRPLGFALAERAASGVTYDGPPAAPNA
jgi:citrate synthase